MSADYEFGTVAFATVRGVENVRVTKNRAGWWTTADPVNHDMYHGTDVVSDVRPLLVLDPDDVEQVKTLRDWLGHLNYYGTIGQLQSSLRQMTRPPKPAEPQGLGAVVEDTEGEVWVRNCPADCEDGGLCIPWRRAKDAWTATYDEFDVVRKLSDGWEPKP